MKLRAIARKWLLADWPHESDSVVLSPAKLRPIHSQLFLNSSTIHNLQMWWLLVILPTVFSVFPHQLRDFRRHCANVDNDRHCDITCRNFLPNSEVKDCSKFELVSLVYSYLRVKQSIHCLGYFLDICGPSKRKMTEGGRLEMMSSLLFVQH